MHWDSIHTHQRNVSSRAVNRKHSNDRKYRTTTSNSVRLLLATAVLINANISSKLKMLAR